MLKTIIAEQGGDLQCQIDAINEILTKRDNDAEFLILCATQENNKRMEGKNKTDGS